MLATLHRAAAGAALTLLLAAASLTAQTRVTPPRQHFGFDIGEDYQLSNYSAMVEYWTKLDRESDRMVVQEIGKTAEGRPQVMAIITSPENHRQLDRYRDISRRLALADGLTDTQARALAAEGRTIVWIDGGLHADEVLGAQQLIATVHELVSSDDAEVMRILRDVIVLAVHANPDGMELVSNWYTREPDLRRRSTSNLPRLYQKYIGHDNNRDFYMSSQPETRNMNRVLYREWFPQIIYNHHQTGPAGTVMFAPPFRDPFNYNYDPLIPPGIDLVGAAMHTRFAAEGKPGVTMRSGANYSTWWNGGLRTTAYFHNMIGLLTETIGNPTPMDIPFLPRKQLPSNDLPAPIAPQRWHFRQSIEYSLTANRAVLDIASRYREQFLFNIYRMGRNSIERGSRDHWTASPARIDSAVAVALKDPQPLRSGGRTVDPSDANGPYSTPERFHELLRAPSQRDARGYIIPADQPDFLTAVKFVNALIDNGISVHRASRGFSVGGRSYPAGSLVVKTAQAFRPHILDMFEPQDHPNDIPYPGGPPTAPYDNAGYTLAYQMGVRFDRVLDDFKGPFEAITGYAAPAAGRVVRTRRAAGYTLSHATNDAFRAVSRLLSAGDAVYWLREDTKLGRRTHPAGTFFITARTSTTALLDTIARETGVSFEAATAKPHGEHFRLRLPRVGLWDRYGGSSPSGWTRWIFEQYGVPYELVFAPQLDAGGLELKYDALVFPTGAIPDRDSGTSASADGDETTSPSRIPEEYRNTVGKITVGTTVPQLRSFLERGGSLIAIGSSTIIAQHLGLPIGDALVETTDGKPRRLDRTRFYIPGSVLSARVDRSSPLAAGITDPVDVFFDESPALRLGGDTAARGVRRVAWFDSPSPLRSGWAWGQRYLEGATAVAEAPLGRGRLFLFAPEILFRAQPHGTFKFLFNALYYGTAQLSRVQ